MTVRILHQRDKEAECSYCGARLAYQPVDTFERTFSDYTGDRETARCIRCPNCGNDVRVKR